MVLVTVSNDYAPDFISITFNVAEIRNSKKRYVTYRKTNKKKAQIPPEEKESVRIAFLGGINEIGKNMTLYEYGNDMFLVDCGLAFPDSDLPGVYP